ncbi:MAG: hypothetical protein ACR2LE_00515 [Nocardioidaceae bacterium]
MTWPRRVSMLTVVVVLAGCTGGAGRDASPHGAGESAVSRSASTRQDQTGWVVLVGDSYISGEGSRWAGNTAGSRSRPVDALGPSAYDDAGDYESEPGCHRAVRFAHGLGAHHRGKVLACSGATAVSHFAGRQFKPGLDFFRDDRGHVGQARALQRFAATHQVSDVVVSIGGNDLGFGSVVGTCVTDFVSTVGSVGRLCRDDPRLARSLEPRQRARLSNSIAQALSRVAEAMRRAGYDAGDYAVVVQSYPSPLAPGGHNRYPENQFARTLVAGCPVYDADASWADSVVLGTLNAALAIAVRRSGLANAAMLDLSGALMGHRLCETGVGPLPQRGLESWRQPGASARLEWVTMLAAKAAPWQPQESFHPNYWGTLAERRCLRLMLATVPMVSVSCRQAKIQSAFGQPAMRLS